MALVLINKNTYQEQVKKLLTGVWTDCSDCLQILGKPVAFGSSHVVAKELKSCPVLFKSTFCYISSSIQSLISIAKQKWILLYFHSDPDNAVGVQFQIMDQTRIVKV